MSVTPTTLKTLFPEFASQTDPRVQLFLDQALRRVDSDVFGDLYDDATSYLAAHLLTVAQRNSAMFAAGAAGPVVSESVGSVSRSFANTGAASTEASLESTPYGSEFCRLMQMALPTPVLSSEDYGD